MSATRILLAAILTLFCIPLAACEDDCDTTDCPQSSGIDDDDSISDDDTDDDDADDDTTAEAPPEVSEPVIVVPSPFLPAEVITQPANNNLDVVEHEGRIFLAFRTGPTHFASREVV